MNPTLGIEYRVGTHVTVSHMQDKHCTGEGVGYIC